MSARLSIALCCFFGALVLIVSMVLNMSAKHPDYTISWVEGIAGVALLGIGIAVRRPSH